MIHCSVLVVAWILHALGLVGAACPVLFAARGWLRQVLLAGLAAPGPAGGLNLLVEAAGLALLGLVGLPALLLGCSKVVYAALLG